VDYGGCRTARPLGVVQKLFKTPDVPLMSCQRSHQPWKALITRT